VRVYKVGDEPERKVYVVGKTSGGQWAGLKTRIVETQRGAVHRPLRLLVADEVRDADLPQLTAHAVGDPLVERGPEFRGRRRHPPEEGVAHVGVEARPRRPVPARSAAAVATLFLLPPATSCAGGEAARLASV
jgi:hypothetical protein